MTRAKRYELTIGALILGLLFLLILLGAVQGYAKAKARFYADMKTVDRWHVYDCKPPVGDIIECKLKMHFNGVTIKAGEQKVQVDRDKITTESE